MAAAGGARGCTSFQRRPGAGPRPPAVPGTRPSVRHGQLLLSSGLPSLDCVLGGGVAVGTLLLLEEDKYGLYSKLLFKYFLAEGVVCGHDLFIASAREHPDNILKELPAPLLDDTHQKELGDEAAAVKSEDFHDSMKIAWRYQNLPKMEASPTTYTKFGHYYDISKKMSPELCQSIKWHSFYLHEELSFEPKMKTCNMNNGYARLLQSIQRIISQEGFDGSDPQNKAIMERVTNLSDVVVGLESFIGSERETNPLYKDYHGLVHVHQIPRLNSLICDVSDTKDLAFRLKRKLFTIERLHLPPDLSDTVSRASKQDLAGSAKLLSSGCGAMAIGKKHLDF
ncbi:elongator complex protein 4 isoform X6 [Corvus kubaryi]|uniref:elongator complex protein 4 isoform X6 n=1 Tax=Corvus kubaryi TaxID=68294 RepID=UPI001C05DF44|nr:elongator complex protein 4 isoform X6 [Corvus kubaryi]